jgi:hypothetical protein
VELARSVPELWGLYRLDRRARSVIVMMSQQSSANNPSVAAGHNKTVRVSANTWAMGPGVLFDPMVTRPTVATQRMLDTPNIVRPTRKRRRLAVRPSISAERDARFACDFG